MPGGSKEGHNTTQTIPYYFEFKRRILGAFAKLRKETIRFVICPSFRSSVRPFLRPHNSAPTGRKYIKFDIIGFFENLFRKFKFHENRTTITGTLHEHQYTFSIISRSVLLTMKNVSDKQCRENQTRFVFSNIFFFENRAVYEIKWKIM